MKRALVIRHGSWGDMIIASVLPPYLKKDGFEVHFLTGARGLEILAHNPRIDRLIPYADGSVPNEELEDFYSKLSRDYDKAIILSGSIESHLVYAFPYDEYWWPLEKRRKRCEANYYEETVRLGGYEPNGVRTGELYFSPEELAFSSNFRHKFKDRFLILWALSGSAVHKVYAFYEEVARAVCKAIPEALIVTVGSEFEMLLTFEDGGKQVINLVRYDLPIRSAMALTRIADLVVGPDTAVLNAAGCFDTPKIVLCSHSSVKNISGTWKNNYSLQAKCFCSPCHLLHTYKNIWKHRCPLDKELLHRHGAEVPACSGEGFPPRMVFDRIMEVYKTRSGKGLIL